MLVIREAELSQDVGDVRRLWLEYFTWVNGELETRYGYPTETSEELDHEMATVAKYGRPDGRLLIATLDGLAIGTIAMLRIGSATAELKRMYVQPGRRGSGVGRALVDELMTQLEREGYGSVQLDSPDFLTIAHALYRSVGFVDREPYPETEIPSEWFAHWRFMERRLHPQASA